MARGSRSATPSPRYEPTSDRDRDRGDGDAAVMTTEDDEQGMRKKSNNDGALLKTTMMTDEEEGNINNKKGVDDDDDAADDDDASRFLRVDNLTRAINEAHLEEIFAHYGEVVRVVLPVDRTVNRPTGFAFVAFEEMEDAREARMSMHGGGSSTRTRPFVYLISTARQCKRCPADVRTCFHTYGLTTLVAVRDGNS